MNPIGLEKINPKLRDNLWSLPIKWEWKIFDEISEVKSGSTPKTSIKDYWGGEIVWITPNDLSKFKGVYIADSERKISREGYNSCSTQLVPKDSIVFSSRAPIGYVAIAGVELCTNQGCKNFVLKNGAIPKYVYYYLLIGKQFAEDLASGTTFKEISGKGVKRIPIPLPPTKAEQRLIVSEIEKHFTRLDAAVAGLRDVKKKLETYRKSVLKAAFENNLIESLEPLKNKIKLISGQHVMNEDYNEIGEGIPYLTGPIDFRNKYPNIRKWTKKPKVIAKKNDVLITVKGSGVGKTNLLMEESACISRQLMALRSEKVLPDYILWYLRYQFDTISRLSTGTAIPGIGRQSILNFLFPYTNKEKQQKIIDDLESRFSVVDKLEETVDNALLKAEQLRKSILKSAFEGKLVKYDDNNDNGSQDTESMKQPRQRGKALSTI